MTCLLIALQEGGVVYHWGSGRVIGFLVAFGVGFAIFFQIQIYMKDFASVNTLILRKKHVLLLSLLNFAVGSSYFSVVFYCPIYFQAVKGSDAINSGVESLALVIPIAITSLAAGLVVSKFGKYHYNMIFGVIFVSVGAGLLSTLQVSTGSSKWVAYQVIAGLGLGIIYMQGFIASQALSLPQDRANAGSIVVFWQFLGATIWVSLSQSIYQCQLLAGIKHVPNLDIDTVINSGVTEFRHFVSPVLLPMVTQAAASALNSVFIAAAGVSTIGCIGIFGVEWRKIEKDHTE